MRYFVAIGQNTKRNASAIASMPHGAIVDEGTEKWGHTKPHFWEKYYMIACSDFSSVMECAKHLKSQGRFSVSWPPQVDNAIQKPVVRFPPHNPPRYPIRLYRIHPSGKAYIGIKRSRDSGIEVLVRGSDVAEVLGGNLDLLRG